MKRLVPITTAIALIAALVTTSASAKGASEALITGPGLGAGISLGGDGYGGGSAVGGGSHWYTVMPPRPR